MGTTTRLKPYFGLVSVIAVSALVLYVLSIGLACRLARHKVVTVSQVANVYRPLLTLDFHSPPALQKALTAYVDLWGARDKLDSVRQEPFWCRYDVGDFTCRYRKRVRRPAFPGEHSFARNVNHEPVAHDWLTELISCRIDPDTWDEVGGRGHILPDPKTKSLRVFQTRGVQAAIARFLRQLRQIRRESPAEADLDLISLVRIQSHSGLDLNWELSSHSLIVDRKRDGRWEFDGMPIASVDDLFERLASEPREAFGMGIYAPLNEDYLPASDLDRLVKFCRNHDVDLFVLDRTSIENVIGTALPRVTWEVRRKKSIYADRPAPVVR